MNVILLYSERRHVLATHIAVFRVVSGKNINIFILRRNHATGKIISLSCPSLVNL
jgi:hypothetical protein